MTKLRCIVLHEADQKAEITVEDATGRIRRVTLTWLTKDDSPIDSAWWQQVLGELEEQNTIAKEKSTGRVLF